MAFVVFWESRIAVATSISATVLGGWMAVRSLGRGGLPGCGNGSGCDAVTRGRWSRIGPVPVAILGVVMYAGLSVAALAHAGFLNLFDQRLNDLFNVVLLALVGAAVWFTVLQVFVIRRLCAYCMAAHLLSCSAACLILAGPDRWAAAGWPSEMILAAACVISFALGQVFIAPRTFAVTKIGVSPADSPRRIPQVIEEVPNRVAAPAPPAARPTPIDRPTGGTGGGPPVAKRRVSLLSGNIVMDVDGWPLLGRRDAPHVIAFLFDFTCKECHHLYRLLSLVVDRRPDWLAVALVPVPLHPQCNPAITCTREAGTQACEYARLAWAVWLASGDHYDPWSKYVNAEPDIQPYGMALIRAKELVDLNRFRLREADPLLDRAVGTGVGLFQAAGKPKLPAILLPSAVMQGHFADLTGLLQQLERYLPNHLA